MIKAKSFLNLTRNTRLAGCDESDNFTVQLSEINYQTSDRIAEGTIVVQGTKIKGSIYKSWSHHNKYLFLSDMPCTVGRGNQIKYTYVLLGNIDINTFKDILTRDLEFEEIITNSTVKIDFRTESLAEKFDENDYTYVSSIDVYVNEKNVTEHLTCDRFKLDKSKPLVLTRMINFTSGFKVYETEKGYLFLIEYKDIGYHYAYIGMKEVNINNKVYDLLNLIVKNLCFVRVNVEHDYEGYFGEKLETKFKNAVIYSSENNNVVVKTPNEITKYKSETYTSKDILDFLKNMSLLEFKKASAFEHFKEFKEKVT